MLKDRDVKIPVELQALQPGIYLRSFHTPKAAVASNSRATSVSMGAPVPRGAIPAQPELFYDNKD